MVKGAKYRRATRHKKQLKNDVANLITCEEDLAGSVKRAARKWTFMNRKKKSPSKYRASLSRTKGPHRRRKTFIREENAAKDIELELETGPKESTISYAEKIADSAMEWVKKTCNKGLRAILEEFTVVRKFIPPDISSDAFNQYPAKNRYTDVVCLDKTRVILKDRPKNNNYIHANWVQLPSKRRYICTQGPLDETIEDFWWMIYKEDVRAIVMLCEFVEDGESKCAEYYPTTTGEKIQYGDVTVKKEKEEEPFETIICQIFSIQNQDEEKHKVYHYKWPTWPDRTAPQTSEPLLALITKIKPLHEKGPIAVHCSAGIGRTGTLCAVDYAMDRLSEDGTISAGEIVKEIRQQRLHSVQSVLQYLYMHICLIDTIMLKKLSEPDLTAKFRRDYGKYLKKYNERLQKERESSSNA